jgi:hypothetical protein
LAAEVSVERGKRAQFDVLADDEMVASRTISLFTRLFKRGLPREDLVLAELRARAGGR